MIGLYDKDGNLLSTLVSSTLPRFGNGYVGDITRTGVADHLELLVDGLELLVDGQKLKIDINWDDDHVLRGDSIFVPEEKIAPILFSSNGKK